MFQWSFSEAERSECLKIMSRFRFLDNGWCSFFAYAEYILLEVDKNIKLHVLVATTVNIQSS